MLRLERSESKITCNVTDIGSVFHFGQSHCMTADQFIDLVFQVSSFFSAFDTVCRLFPEVLF